jgi:hypothetical protein
MKYKFFFLLLFLSATIYSQVSMYNGFTDYRTLADTDYMNNLRGDKGKLKISEIRGTPYLIDSFQSGSVIDTITNTKASAYLRFDVFNDVFEIQVKLGDQKLMKLDRSPRFQYVLNDEKFVLIQTDKINDDHYIAGNGYAVELTSPEFDVVLYKRYTKKFNPGKKAETSYGTSMPSRINDETVYLIKSKNEFKLADSHRKRILEIFPKDKRGKIEKYIKNKKLKFRGSEKEIDQDMIQTIRYYNSL